MTRRLIALTLGLLLLSLGAIGVALAQGGELGGKLLAGNDVTIPATETVDHDIYAFAGNVTVNGTVRGDIVAAGGNIDINGPVTGDVLAAGGRINLNGPVDGDVRAAGGQIAIGGDVTEDVLATGGQLTVSGKVGQDLIASGGTLTLSGSVSGSAAGSVGTYTKSGSVAGSDSIKVTGDQSQAFAPAPSNPILDALRQFIVVFVVALIALWLAPRATAAADAFVHEQPLPALGWGILAFLLYVVVLILVVLAAILLGIVLAALGFGGLVGLDVFAALVLLGGITLAFVVVVAFLADAIVGLALARLIARSTGRPVPSGQVWAAGRDRWTDIGLLAVGVAIVVVLTALPGAIPGTETYLDMLRYDVLQVAQALEAS
jgi:cytoskeletal protein CcmA (bactofilin family)